MQGSKFPEGFSRADYLDDPHGEELLENLATSVEKAQFVLDLFLRDTGGLFLEQNLETGVTNPVEGEKKEVLETLQSAVDNIREIYRRLRTPDPNNPEWKNNATSNGQFFLVELQVALKKADDAGLRARI